MALNAYLKLKGATQGEITGSVTQRGRENSIMVVAYSHDVMSPRDAASGLPTGKRMHKPITITKEIDKASPLLYSAMVNNENIDEFTLDFWRPSAAGAEVQFYTVTLLNATISEMREYMLDNKVPENMKFPPMETVSFTYQKITWTWKDGGITAEDDWQTPNA